MKPGFLLEAARKNAKSILQGGLTICAISALVLVLNGRYVYNWVAGPFPMNSALAESPGMKEFGQIDGSLIGTGLAEQSTTSVRVFRRALETSSTSASAIYYLFPLNNKFVVVKTAPDFSAGAVRGRLVPLPDKIRSFPKLSEIKVGDDRTLQSDDLYPTMLDASFSYRADANLFVILAAIFLALGLLGTAAALTKSGNPQKYPMLRLLARSGAVQSTLRRAEQEFIAAGNDVHVGPLLISANWVYDPGPRCPDLHHERRCRSIEEGRCALWKTALLFGRVLVAGRNAKPFRDGGRQGVRCHDQCDRHANSLGRDRARVVL